MIDYSSKKRRPFFPQIHSLHLTTQLLPLSTSHADFLVITYSLNCCDLSEYRGFTCALSIYLEFSDLYSSFRHSSSLICSEDFPDSKELMISQILFFPLCSFIYVSVHSPHYPVNTANRNYLFHSLLSYPQVTQHLTLARQPINRKD